MTRAAYRNDAVAHFGSPTRQRRQHEDRGAQRRAVRIHHQLTEAAGTWANLDQEPAPLYRGSRITQAAQWASTTRSELSTRETSVLRGKPATDRTPLPVRRSVVA